jgi:putative FmdB family regulatory protein
MPIYEYVCERCGAKTEAIQRVSDPPLTECAKCGGPLRKKVSAPAFQFKGSGWYVTDYARKGGDAAGKSGESSGSGDGESVASSAKKVESKTEPATKPAKDAKD